MAVDDRVAIRFGGKDLRICIGYEVDIGVMTQPSQFGVRIGHGGLCAELLQKHPPGTDFELLISGQGSMEDRPQFVGKVDARAAAGQTATVTFRGRDGLAQLLDATALADKTFKDATYKALVEACMKDARMDGWTLVDDSLDDAAKKAGAPAFALKATTRETGFKERTTKTIVHPPQIRAGQSYYTFLKEHLDRAGLFLYAATDKKLVLMRPPADGKPLYRIVNRAGRAQDGAPGNVLDFQFTDDSAHRMSEVLIFGRGGGGKFGRSKAQAKFADDEMLGWALNKPMAIVDTNVSSPDEAAFFARRKLAESRRQGWSLTYTVPGHTTPSIAGAGRLVWARNTFVEIDDAEIGVTGTQYIEHVTFSGDATRTTTTLRVMRPKDLLFGVDLD